MNSKVTNYRQLLKKVEDVTKQKGLDLSSGEDLSIGIMNLISIEEHLFYTFNKTKDEKVLDLLNEIRKMRTELMREIVKEPKGEVWCISKHLLAASMRIMEVGTKELKKAEGLGQSRKSEGAELAEAKNNKDKARDLFEKSYQLYSLFWGLNLGIADSKNLQPITDNNDKIEFINDTKTHNLKPTTSPSVFSKLGNIINKALDCCRE